MKVYTNYFYDTSVIFSTFIIAYREPFTDHLICIGHDRRTVVIGIDWHTLQAVTHDITVMVNSTSLLTLPWVACN